MKIKNITIENCRGIDRLTISEELIPNKPYIFVAPNGFGKTSFAHAFTSIIGHKCIKLNEDDRFNDDQNKKASIAINFESDEYSGILVANETMNSNSIRDIFDICVLTNPQHVKAIHQNFASYIPPKGKIVIDPIEICPKINSVNCPITKTDLRKEFGSKSYLVIDFSNIICNNKIANVCIALLDFIKPLLKEKIYKHLLKLKNEILLFDDNKIQNDNWLELNNLIETNVVFHKCHKIIKNAFDKNNINSFCILWEILISCKRNFKNTREYFEYKRYEFYKKNLISLIDTINSSKYKKATVNEKNKILKIEIPEPKMISNGQRDILSLIGLLYKAKIQLQKTYAILIIDELFDYLDDANMTVAQYYISMLIEDFKITNRKIFPIILTHLNPNFFRNYVFQKQKVIFLKSGNQQVTNSLQRLIDIRDCKEIEEQVSKYLLHYYPYDFDIKEQLKPYTDIRNSWGKKGVFIDFLKAEYEKYVNCDCYDPLAVCLYTRIKIEENTYNALKANKDLFLNKHKTWKKLYIALETGIELPESYFLLRIIYDEGAHSSTSKNNTSAIEAKLENQIIKEMIVETVSKKI